MVTRLVVGLCVVLHVLQIVGEYGNADASLHPQGRRPHGFFSLLQLSRNTLCPVLVWESPLQEWPRLFTSAVFHANLWHLMMNMVSTVALGARLERHHAFGSLWMLCTTISAILLTGVTHILLAFAMYQLTGNQEAWRGHSVGFSAVLFHYLTLECHIENDANHSSNSSATTRSSSSRRSLFGFVDVPSRVYPWALYVPQNGGRSAGLFPFVLIRKV